MTRKTAVGSDGNADRFPAAATVASRRKPDQSTPIALEDPTRNLADLHVEGVRILQNMMTAVDERDERMAAAYNHEEWSKHFFDHQTQQSRLNEQLLDVKREVMKWKRTNEARAIAVFGEIDRLHQEQNPLLLNRIDCFPRRRW